MIESFSGSYAEARKNFIAAAGNAKARIHQYGPDDLVGQDGEPLTCDVAVLGSEDAAAAAIVIAGLIG